jgi:hypothetical protein
MKSPLIAMLHRANQPNEQVTILHTRANADMLRLLAERVSRLEDARKRASARCIMAEDAACGALLLECPAAPPFHVLLRVALIDCGAGRSPNVVLQTRGNTSITLYNVRWNSLLEQSSLEASAGELECASCGFVNDKYALHHSSCSDHCVACAATVKHLALQVA